MITIKSLLESEDIQAFELGMGLLEAKRENKYQVCEIANYLVRETRFKISLSNKEYSRRKIDGLYSYMMEENTIKYKYHKESFSLEDFKEMVNRFYRMR